MRLLKPFAQFTKLLEGNNINTLSIVIPSLILLESHLNNLKDEFFDKKVIENLKNQLLKSLCILENLILCFLIQYL